MIIKNPPAKYIRLKFETYDLISDGIKYKCNMKSSIYDTNTLGAFGCNRTIPNEIILEACCIYTTGCPDCNVYSMLP